MSRRIEPIEPWTIKDMEIATGKSRQTVIALINAGELPGYKTSTGQYIIPGAWADEWQHGRWTPRSMATPDEQPTQLTPDNLIRRREGKKTKAA